MAYKKKEIFEKAKLALDKNPLLFVEDIIAYLPCDKTTFYRMFPPKCNEYNELKEILETNRIKVKTEMRKKWYSSTNSSLQIALYKLVSTKKEAHRLNGSNVKADITSKGKQIHAPSSITVNIVKPLDYEDEDE